MELIFDRYRVVVNHSEMFTVYYIVDTWADDDEQPAIVASWKNSKRFDEKLQEARQDRIREADHRGITVAELIQREADRIDMIRRNSELARAVALMRERGKK